MSIVSNVWFQSALQNFRRIFYLNFQPIYVRAQSFNTFRTRARFRERSNNCCLLCIIRSTVFSSANAGFSAFFILGFSFDGDKKKWQKKRSFTRCIHISRSSYFKLKYFCRYRSTFSVLRAFSRCICSSHRMKENAFVVVHVNINLATKTTTIFFVSQ